MFKAITALSPPETPRPANMTQDLNAHVHDDAEMFDIIRAKDKEIDFIMHKLAAQHAHINLLQRSSYEFRHRETGLFARLQEVSAMLDAERRKNTQLEQMLAGQSTAAESSFGSLPSSQSSYVQSNTGDELSIVSSEERAIDLQTSVSPPHLRATVPRARRLLAASPSSHGPAVKSSPKPKKNRTQWALAPRRSVARSQAADEEFVLGPTRNNVKLLPRSRLHRVRSKTRTLMRWTLRDDATLLLSLLSSLQRAGHPIPWPTIATSVSPSCQPCSIRAHIDFLCTQLAEANHRVPQISIPDDSFSEAAEAIDSCIVFGSESQFSPKEKIDILLIALLRACKHEHVEMPWTEAAGMVDEKCTPGAAEQRVGKIRKWRGVNGRGTSTGGACSGTGQVGKDDEGEDGEGDGEGEEDEGEDELCEE